MDGAHTREFDLPRAMIAVAVIALVAAVVTPMAVASSPSQDQYGSAIPGVGGSGGSGSPSTSTGSGSGGESTIPVAPSPSSSSSAQPNSDSTASSGGGPSDTSSKGGSGHKVANQAGNATRNGETTPVSATKANQSVPHIAADSAGNGWVPFFIAGLLALGAAGGVLVYRNRRRAAQS